MPAPRQITIGVPLYAFQAIDVIGPVDIINTASYTNLVHFKTTTEAEASRLGAVDITFHYIGPNPEDLQPLSGSISIKATTTYATCPKLDYMLLGGPDPGFALAIPNDLKEFITERSKEVKTILTTCTGALVLATTGVLDGVHATVNHLFVDPAKEWFPAVKWDKVPQWVTAEGPNGVTIWTASGAGAGMDMVAQWYREEFCQELLDYVTSLLEWQPRDVHGKSMRYKNGNRETVDV